MMTRKETLAFIESLKSMRASATDEQAIHSPSIYPQWRAEIVYNIDDRVLYNGILYKVLQSHTSQSNWAPDITPSLFAEVLIPDPSVIPEWNQPDSTNPYMTGDKVKHNEQTWVSIVDNNVWEPGVYGWDKI